MIKLKQIQVDITKIKHAAAFLILVMTKTFIYIATYNS